MVLKKAVTLSDIVGIKQTGKGK